MYKFLNQQYDYLVSCLDHDHVGKKTAFKMYKRYGIQPYFLTESFNGKDPFDFCVNEGLERFKIICKTILEQHIDKIRELEIEQYNQLKFIQDERRYYQKERARLFKNVPFW